jgi:hypothetical protein
MPEERIVKDVPAEEVSFWSSVLETDEFTVHEQHEDDIITLLGTKEDTPATPTPATPPPSVPGSQLAWGSKVSAEFRSKVIACCERLQMTPDFLMAAMAFETGETFSPSARNIASGATGLIQFMPSTAEGLHTTTAALAAMSAVDQLDFVERYLRPHTGKLATIEDTYMAILFPRAIGQLNSFVLFSAPSKAYTQNRGLDANKDGRVTKAEAAAKVQLKLARGSTPAFRA